MEPLGNFLTRFVNAEHIDFCDRLMCRVVVYVQGLWYST